jgi:hypothetical protein
MEGINDFVLCCSFDTSWEHYFTVSWVLVMKSCLYCEKRVWWFQKKVAIEIRHAEGVSYMYFHFKCGTEIGNKSDLPSIEDLADESTTEK